MPKRAREHAADHRGMPAERHEPPRFDVQMFVGRMDLAAAAANLANSCAQCEVSGA